MQQVGSLSQIHAPHGGQTNAKLCAKLGKDYKTKSVKMTNGTNGVVMHNNFATMSPKSATKEDIFSWTKQWYLVLSAFYLSNKKPIPITVLGHNLMIWKMAKGAIS